MNSAPPDAGKSRHAIIYEAARIMADDGVRDFQRAKEKACARLSIGTERSLPANSEIEVELASRLRLFDGTKTSRLWHEHLAIALEVMEVIRDQSPVLTGAALSGAVTDSRPVEIHAFASDAEEVCAALDDAQIRYRLIDKRVRAPRGRIEFVPVAKFLRSDIEVDVLIITRDAAYPVLNPVDGKPMQRASLKKVRKWVRELNLSAEGAEASD